MTNLTEAIDHFSRTYLEQREDNAWDIRANGPLEENSWAQRALEELLLPKGYSQMREVGEENAGFVRDNPDGSIDRVLFGDPIKYCEQRFGKRYASRETANILAHLHFENLAEAERYDQLREQMEQLSEQEGITHRGGVEYRPIGAVMGSAAGGVLSLILAVVPIPWKELIGLEPGPADSFIAFLLLTFGGVGGWYIGKHKMNKTQEYRTKLKRDYDQLFQEFKHTFGARFTYGKEALSAALEMKS